MNRKPNILWICTDQQRRDTLGCCGNPFTHTPNIDALAASVASTNQNDRDLLEAINGMSTRIQAMETAITNSDTNHTFNFNIPFDINGREFARAQSSYTQAELDRMEMLESRKLGIL